MKKRALLLLAAALLCGSLCACGRADTGEPLPPTPTAAPTPEPTPEPTIAPVTVCGVTAAWDAEELDLSGAAADAAALAAALPALPQLSRVDLTGWALTRAEQLTLHAAAPDIHFVWTVEAEGVACSSEEAFLDLSGVAVDVATLEEALPLLPALTQVDMLDCGVGDEAMYELNQRWANVRFVWKTRLGPMLQRTDLAYYRASDGRQGKTFLSDATLDAQLRYFPELVALDLGHAWGYVHRCDWVQYTPKLQILILACCCVTDVSPLAQLQELSYLEIFTNKELTDVSALAACTALRDLNISFLPITDIAALEALPALERLWVVHCQQLTQTQLDAFRASRPDCELVWSYDSWDVTGFGWRKHERYYWMRDMFDSGYLD